MAQTATMTLTLVIEAGLVITTTSLPNAVEGQSYSFQLMASGGSGNYTWSLAPGSNALPMGITLSANGLLSGTPSVAGSFSFTVQVQSN